VFASIESSIVVGVDGQPVTVEVHAAPGLPGLTHRGPARCIVPGGSRSGPRRGDRLGHRVARQAHHREPRAHLHAQGRQRARPRHRHRRPRRHRCGAARPVAGHGFLGELGLDGTVRPVHGVPSRWSMRCGASTRWCRSRARPTRAWSRDRWCTPWPPSARWWRRWPAMSPGLTTPPPTRRRRRTIRPTCATCAATTSSGWRSRSPRPVAITC
jgi:hypothetical protein